MKSLADCSLAFDQILLSLWPESRIRMDFTPRVSGGDRDVCSDALLRLASERREAPDALASIFYCALPQVLLEYTSIENGFVNFSGPETVEWLTIPEPTPAPKQGSQIVFVPGDGEVPPFTWLRLLFYGVAQAFFAAEHGRTSRLSVGTSLHSVSPAMEGIPPLVRAVLKESQPSKTPIEYLFALAETPGADLSVWLTPSLYPRRDFVHFLQAREAGEREVAVHLPDPSWMTSHEPLPSREAMGEWSDDALSALLLYLPSVAVGSDVDPWISHLGDRSNIRWGIDAALARIERLFGEEGAGESSFDCSEVAPFERALLMKLKFFAWNWWAAGARGALYEFLHGIAVLLQDFDRFLNNPDLRHRISGGRVRPVEHLIVRRFRTLLRGFQSGIIKE